MPGEYRAAIREGRENMRVCRVNSFYPPYVGGAETYVSNLARNLVALGHDVTVYCGDRPLAPGISYDGKVKVVRMRVPLSFYGTPLASFPASFASGHFDLVHCNFPNPYFTAISGAVSRFEGIPAVLTYHNDLPAVTSAASTLVGLNDIASVAYLAPYSKIIATTRVYARSSKILRREWRRVEVIPNGVDTKRFNPDIECEWVKKKYNLKGYKTLLFVGELTTWHTYKGLEVLLQALATASKGYERLKLLVVGDGNLRGHYQKLASQLGVGDRTVFAGHVDDGVLPAYYAASDVAVLPSKDASEGFGIVLLEAMACRKAVIGTRVGGIPEVIKDRETGLLVEPINAGALAHSILELIQGDDLRTSLGRNGRTLAEKRDWRIIARRTEAVYGSSVGW